MRRTGVDIQPHPRHRSGHGRTSSLNLGSAGAALRPDKPPRGASGHHRPAVNPRYRATTPYGLGGRRPGRPNGVFTPWRQPSVAAIVRDAVIGLSAPMAATRSPHGEPLADAASEYGRWPRRPAFLAHRRFAPGGRPVSASSRATPRRATSRTCRAGTPTTNARGRDVARHDRAGGHERLLADLDAGHEHRAAADPAGAAQRRAAQRAVRRRGGSSCRRSSSTTPGPTKTSSSTTLNAVT